MSKWNTGVYLRLSSDDGDKSESNSIANQRSIIKRFISNNKELKNVTYYTDDGYSGTTFDRPNFQNLLKDIKSLKINCVIVKDLSRFGRNYIEVGNYLEKIFPSYNVRFIAINDNIDSYKDPKSVNNVIVPFKNLMNDEYARDISNKVRSVLDNKRLNGQFIGSTAPYGYLRDPKNKHNFIIDKPAAKVVKKIFQMALDGKSRKQIEDELNSLGVLPPAMYKIEQDTYNYEIKDKMKQWNRRKINIILQNETYTGDLIQGKRKSISHKIHKVVEVDENERIIIKNHHKAIIERKDYDKVQNQYFNRVIRTNKKNEYDLFSGHLRCVECGNNLVIKNNQKYKYYNCSTYLSKKLCCNHSIRKDKLESLVLEIINNYKKIVKDLDYTISKIINEENINYDSEIIKNRIRESEKNIEKYVMLRESIKDDLKEKFITEAEYWEYNNEYSEELMMNKNLKKELEQKLNKLANEMKDSLNWTKNFSDGNILEKLNNEIIGELIEDICIDKNKDIKIIFRDEDKYFQAIDFLNRHKCDIIQPD